MSDSALPKHLQGQRHWDWPWPFNKISRGATAFSWGEPVKLAGNQQAHELIMRPDPISPWIKVADKALLPIGEEGSWQLSYFPEAPLWALKGLYFARSSKRGSDGKFLHIRIGSRWDNVDHYVQFPSVGARRYTGDRIEDTSTR